MEPYVEQCIFSGLQEADEPRDAFSMKDVRPASVLGSGAGTQEDVRLARGLIHKYPDLDMPYYWLSHHHALKGDFGEARAILDQGIKRCKRKRYLCDEYGSVEYEADQVLQAVKWWIRSAILQLASNTLDGYGPFMYLAYVAEYCGLKDQSRKLFEITDEIRSIRLNSDGQHRLRIRLEMLEGTDKRAVIAAIEAFMKLQVK